MSKDRDIVILWEDFSKHMSLLPSNILDAIDKLVPVDKYSTHMNVSPSNIADAIDRLSSTNNALFDFIPSVNTYVDRLKNIKYKTDHKEMLSMLGYKDNHPFCTTINVNDVNLIIDFKKYIQTYHFDVIIAALARVVKNGYLDVFQFFLESWDLDPSMTIYRDESIALTPLLVAINNGRLNIVKYLVSRGVDVNETTKLKELPIMVAADYNQLPTLKYLVEVGAKIDCKRSDGSTLVHGSAYRGHIDVLKYCIETLKMPYNVFDNHDMTPLMLASTAGHLAEVNYLVSLQNIDLNAQAISGETAFFLAAIQGHSAIVRYLCNHNADMYIEDSNNFCAITRIMSNADMDMLKCLVEDCKIDINRPNSHNITPLKQAIVSNQHAIIKYLLKNNANPSYLGNGPYQSALGQITAQNNLDLLKYLIEECGVSTKTDDGAGAMVIAIDNARLDIVTYLCEHNHELVNMPCDDVTPLMYAVSKRDDIIVKCLVDHDADLVDNGAFRPLFHSAMIDCIKIIRYFIEECNIDINVRDTKGYTLLMVASHSNSINVVKYLTTQPKVEMNNSVVWALVSESMEVFQHFIEKCNISVNYKSQHAGDIAIEYPSEGNNPMSITYNAKSSLLTIAIACKKLKIVKYLLDKYADVTCVDECGLSVIDTAIKYDNQEALDLLIQYCSVNHFTVPCIGVNKIEFCNYEA